MTRSIPILALVIATFLTASAQQTWGADKAHSEVKFAVSHLVIAEVTGKFKDFDVTVAQKDSNDFVGASVVAEIRTKSIDTEVETRDNHLRSDDFFSADKYPIATFKSTTVSSARALRRGTRSRRARPRTC